MKATLIIFLSLGILKVSACDCKIRTIKESQATSYSSSQLILIGNVVEIDTVTGNYRIEIMELLKGSSTIKTISGVTTTSCSGFPSLGPWIIYADSFEGETIEFSSCGMSRSFSDPQYAMVKDYAYPIPPKELMKRSDDSTNAYLELSKRILTIKEKALADLKIEIEELRKRR